MLKHKSQYTIVTTTVTASQGKVLFLTLLFLHRTFFLHIWLYTYLCHKYLQIYMYKSVYKKTTGREQESITVWKMILSFCLILSLQ